MSNKSILTLASLLVSAGFCFAQSAPAPAAADAHKSHDQKARDCRKAGTDKQLTGDQLLAFVATCMAPPATATK